MTKPSLVRGYIFPMLSFYSRVSHSEQNKKFLFSESPTFITEKPVNVM